MQVHDAGVNSTPKKGKRLCFFYEYIKIFAFRGTGVGQKCTKKKREIVRVGSEFFVVNKVYSCRVSVTRTNSQVVLSQLNKAKSENEGEVQKKNCL